jgi:gamma-glutamyl:cysteine ligase YbdK (ATP-grasp superfamily)
MDEIPERFSHLRLHNGTIWRWVRPLIGFDADGTPHLRIEQRIFPAGPSIADMMANAALYFGLVKFLAEMGEAPELALPFELARENFYAAAKYGLDAQLNWLNGNKLDARTLLKEEILPMARQGLYTMNIESGDIDDSLEILEARIATGQTGTAWQRAYRARHHANSYQMVVAYLEQQRSGAPVHQWEV